MQWQSIQQRLNAVHSAATAEDANQPRARICAQHHSEAMGHIRRGGTADPGPAGIYPGWRTSQRPGESPETCAVRLITQRRSVFGCQQDPRVAHGPGRARHVPDQAVACGGKRSLMGTPASCPTRTIVVKAVPEKYSSADAHLSV
jgi:hypothetical protein